jgi:hypothetical protein
MCVRKSEEDRREVVIAGQKHAVDDKMCRREVRKEAEAPG